MNQSFRELYLQNKDRLTCNVLSLTRNRDLADDLVSSAFIKAFENRKAFRGESAESTWLTAIAFNGTRNFWRHERIRPMDSIDSSFSKELAEPDLLSKTLERSECCVRLRRALRQIPALYRKVLLDHFVWGYSTRQIARQERVPLGTVLSRLFNGKKRLRKAWDRQRLSSSPLFQENDAREVLR
jgi:RNA polymerase sigma-70 factor (ECF subfamily)